MLCDGAHALEGKLYILGGGWSALNVPLFPWFHSVAIAVRLAVPWIDANQPHALRLEVVDDDERPIVPEPLSAQLEVGRPVGTAQGDEIPFVLALTVALKLERETRVNFRLIIREACIARTAFRVHRHPAPAALSAPPVPPTPPAP